MHTGSLLLTHLLSRDLLGFCQLAAGHVVALLLGSRLLLSGLAGLVALVAAGHVECLIRSEKVSKKMTSVLGRERGDRSATSEYGLCCESGEW